MSRHAVKNDYETERTGQELTLHTDAISRACAKPGQTRSLQKPRAQLTAPPAFDLTDTEGDFYNKDRAVMLVRSEP